MTNTTIPTTSDATTDDADMMRAARETSERAAHERNERRMARYHAIRPYGRRDV